MTPAQPSIEQLEQRLAALEAKVNAVVTDTLTAVALPT